MNTENSFTRRNVLKSIGGVTAGAAGLASRASASETTIDQQERRHILHSEKVQRIHEEVGGPSVRDPVKITGEVADDTITAYRFRTDIGELRFVKREQDAVAQFIFGENDGVVRAERSVPQEYEEALDADFASIYTDMKGGIGYIRDATAAEKRSLKASTDVSPDDAQMVYSSELDGFAVQERTEDGVERTLAVTPQSGNAHAVNTRTLSDASVREITSQGNCDADACWDCAAGTLAGIVTCGGGCVLVSWTIAGIVACVGCLIVAGAYIGWKCSRCYNTCS